MDNIIKLLRQLEIETTKLNNQNKEFDTIKGILDNKSGLGLYKCTLDDCEVTIVEYIMATSEEQASKIFNWESYGSIIETILSEEDLRLLFRNLRVRTVDDDMG